MRTTGKRAILLGMLLVLALALTVSACGSDDDSSTGSSTPAAATDAASTGTDTAAADASGPATGEPIKVGAIVSITGPAAFPDWHTGAVAFFKRLNAEGGINGRPVELTALDDKGDPAQASALARRLVGDGAQAFVASLSLFDCAVNRKYYEQQGIVSIDIGSGRECFNSANIDPVNSGPMVDPLMQLLYASEELGFKKICAMAYGVPGEQKDFEEAISYWKKLSGMEPTLVIDGYDQTADPTPAVIKFKNAGCEAVSVSANIDTGVPFMKAVGAQNAKDIQWMMGLATYSDAFAKAVGSDGDGMLMGLEFRSFEDPASKQMLEDFDNMPIPRSMTSVTGWTAAYAFAETVKNIQGDVNKESITKAFKELKPFDVPSMGTPFSFGPGKTHNPNQAAWFVKLQDGKFEDVSKEFFILPEGTIPR